MAQKFEKLVQEDLYTGTGRVWTTAPGGGKLCSTQIGLHSFARGQRAYTAVWAPGAIAAGSKASTTVSVPDAVTGDFVMASHTTLGDTGLTIHGHISASGTASVVVHNPTASAVTVSSGTASVLVFPSGSAVGTGTIDGATGAFYDHWIFRLYRNGSLYDTQHIASDQVAYQWTSMPAGDYYMTVAPSDDPLNVWYTSTTETLANPGSIVLFAYGGGG